MVNSNDVRYVKVYDKDNNELANYDMESDDNLDGVILAIAGKQTNRIALCTCASVNDAMNVARSIITMTGMEINKSALDVSLMIMESIMKTQNGGNNNGN